MNQELWACNAKTIRRMQRRMHGGYRPGPVVDSDRNRVVETVAVAKAKATERKGLMAVCGRAKAAIMGLFR